MATMPPFEQEHQGPAGSRAAMLASTAMPRVGFGLIADAADGADPTAVGLPVIALASAALRIEEGLLMAFGPEGDPIPPGAFLAAAAGQPDAEVRLAGGDSVPALQVAVVLEAQAKGPLGSAHGDRAGSEAWIKAMLGVGPKPVPAADAELRAEPRAGELSVFGQELMLTLPAGHSFLIADAANAQPAAASVGLILTDGQVLSIGDLVGRLRAYVEQGQGAAAPAAATRSGPTTEVGPGSQGRVQPFAEVVLPGCALRSVDDGLVLELPAVGAVRLARLGDAAPPGPRISIFLADGAVAGIADVIAALDRVSALPDEPDARPELPDEPDTRPEPPDEWEARPEPPDEWEARPEPPDEWEARRESSDEPAARPQSPVEPAAGGHQALPSPAARGRPVPVILHPPAIDGIRGERIAALIVRGVPAGGGLSAGIDDGDGRWLLSPRHLAGLTLAPPAGWTEPLRLELTAVAVRDRAGELVTGTATVVVALDPAGATPRLLAIDPALVHAAEPALTALMIRGVPHGARLSAGTYDPAVDGWALRPDQIEGLALMPPLGEVDVTLTVLGISLAPGGRAEARILTRLTIAVP